MHTSEFICLDCKKKVTKKKQGYFCPACGRIYPVIDGIPIFLPHAFETGQEDKQIAYFGKEAQQYETTDQVAPWMQKYIERMFAYLHAKKGKIALDNGCGSGYITFALAQKGVYVYACDINLLALKRIQTIGKSLGMSNYIIPVCCSAEQLPLRDRSIDIVAMNSVLEHIPDEKKAADEITRVSKKGAKCMITVPVKYRYIAPYLLPLHIVYDKKLGHLRRYTAHDLQARFFGWQKRGVHYSGHTPKAIKTLINIVLPIFDEQSIEREDATQYNQAQGSTNITMVFQKQ